MILLDTHAWIWHLSDPSQLSAAARVAIDDARRDLAVHVSSISVWELFMLTKKSRLQLAIAPEAFLHRAERLSYVRFAAVDNGVARRSVQLPDIHGDPADRLILATAQQLGCPVVSKDRRLSDYPDAEIIW
ncbi:MAG: type II toxin-antitoxin system VapC family toxin [Spirochaetaceae bacterium]|nr:type II toxin-antitoxin system VapC family toxin [Spirochaetaceae bacterium]